MTTAPPTELSATNIPVCCAGVQLNLANPGDPTDVRVLVDGTLHPANQVTRNGSFLYIMGLQAGTEYPLNITLSNIFGTVWINTTVRPLLGEQLVWVMQSLTLFVCLGKKIYPHHRQRGRESQGKCSLFLPCMWVMSALFIICYTVKEFLHNLAYLLSNAPASA